MAELEPPFRARLLRVNAQSPFVLLWEEEKRVVGSSWELVDVDRFAEPTYYHVRLDHTGARLVVVRTRLRAGRE